MKRTALVPFALLFALIGVLGLSQNKEIPTRVGYIDAQKVIEAHPRYGELDALQKQAENERKPILEQIQAIEPKLRDGSATAKERQDYEALRKVFDDLGKKWQEKINSVLGPITQEIDAAIAKVAAENGFAVILSANVAAQSGLVVYASPEVDVTQRVIQALGNR